MGDTTPDSFTEQLLRQIQTTIPNATLGFPPAEQMRERKTQREAAKCREWDRQESEEANRLKQLKDRVRSLIRKDRP